MAVKSDLKNMALCLTAVCLVCSAILGGVYAVTYDPIQEATKKALEASIGKVLPEGGDISEAMTVESEGVTYEYYVSTVGSEPLAYAVKSTVIGFGGPLTIMVGLLPDGTVYNTSVLSHSETPGLGAKCQDDPRFLANWKEKKYGEGELKVTKDGGKVDAITASTITSRAYTLAVENAIKAMNRIGGQDNE